MSNKTEELLVNIYQELYENSTPSANFKELVENAEVNELGQKVIPFDDFIINDDKMMEIIKKHLDTTNLPNYQRETIKNTILLGCSPKSIRKKND